MLFEGFYLLLFVHSILRLRKNDSKLSSRQPRKKCLYESRAASASCFGIFHGREENLIYNWKQYVGQHELSVSS